LAFLWYTVVTVKLAGKKQKLLVLSVPVALTSGLCAYLNISGAGSIRLWPCPLFENFGLACPGCGATRCVCRILTLRFYEAVQFNLPVFILFFCLAGAWAACVYKVIRFNSFIKLPNWTLWTALAAFVAFTVIRNLAAFPWHLESPWDSLTAVIELLRN
jgi:hypothetical protein